MEKPTASGRAGNLIFRDEVRPQDVRTVRSLVKSTGFFHAGEVLIAEELIRERLEKGVVSGYHFIFTEEEPGRAVGYTCFGPIPGTRSSFDVYWIAVKSDRQGRGIGKALLARAEQAIIVSGGSRIYIETSSRELYEPTRRFYLSCGYRQEAFIKDFYSPGDGKIIYGKELGK